MSDDRATPLPSFNLHSTLDRATRPDASTSQQTNAPTPASSSSFLQVPGGETSSSAPLRPPQRPKAPSVSLSYRGDSNDNSNSIYRRPRASTVGGSPWNRNRGNSVASSNEGNPATGSEGEVGWALPTIRQEDGRGTASTSAAAQPRGRRRALSALSRWGGSTNGDNDGKNGEKDEEAEERKQKREKHDRQVIDLLDVIDPEVGTLTTLSDVQNSLFVPDLGRWVDRTRYLRLTRPPATQTTPEKLPGTSIRSSVRSSSPPARGRTPSIAPSTIAEAPESDVEQDAELALAVTDTADETDSEKLDHIQARGKYLVLPEGLVDWEHWDDKDREELDDYVRHLLHSKKWKAKRIWRGFKQYFKTPLGAFVTIYASLLTFWGAAWVLFIIGWLHAGDRQAYFVEICDQVLTALFCVVGIGLAPFRAVDTYHMIFIAKYHRKTLRLYKEHGEAPLPDENDLPSPTAARDNPSNAEEGLKRAPVLTVKEQATFIYHQTKFSKSHTFYRPHESFTHKAFPLDLLIVVVCLLDFHSIFQIALGSTTWSM
ncbi:hypothetical protein P7C70_g4208, partial [Phenoliferia sp. Uapishka_3]